MKLLLQIFLFLIAVSTSMLFAQGKYFMHPSGHYLFETDFGYGKQNIHFKNFSLLGKYFHYKIFDHKGMKWEKMSKDPRPNMHYLLETNQSRFHIVFINFDAKSSKLYFTIGKPPNYTQTGAVSVNPGVDEEFLDDFYISAAYTLHIPIDNATATDYMVVFFEFMVPNNSYLESKILLLRETDCVYPNESNCKKFTYALLPGKQISTSPDCFIDYNKDGWLDYVHFNPFNSDPKVSFYQGKNTGFSLDTKYYGTISPSGDLLYEPDMTQSNFP